MIGSRFVCIGSKFFCNSQQQDTNDHDTDEQVGLLGELFLQENAGQQQGNNADGGQNGCCKIGRAHV